MDGHAVDTTNQGNHPTGAGHWRDVGLLFLLLALAVTVRGWLLTHTEVPARDSIGFIRYALAFEYDDWRTVLRNNHQHPGYPLTVLLVSVPARAWADSPETEMPEIMSFSAQLASNIAAVLLVIPMFYLGKLLFHRPAGFGAAALFQCLPVSGHILSDALSEGLFLLLASSTLALAVLAMRTHRPLHFALCGCLCGLTYLTRPEGALLLVSTAVVLLALPFISRQPRTFRQLVSCGSALVVSAVVVGSPYVFATHRFTNKPSVHQFLGKDLPELDQVPTWPPPSVQHRNAPTRPLLASTFAIVLDLNESLGRRAVMAVWGLAGELVKCFHYVGWLPTLLGMWWYRRRAFAVPGMWVLLVLCGLHAVVLWRLAVVVGYMSDRHLMLLLLCGSYATAAATWELPSRLLAWARRQPWSGTGLVSPTLVTGGLAVVLLAGMLAAALPKTLDTLHANRAGYHAAGIWLAQYAKPADVVVDEHRWAHYYAGRVFQERRPVPVPPGYLRVHYIVVGRRDRELPQTWNREKQPEERVLQEGGGQIIYSWPSQCSPTDAAIVVYRMPPR